VVLAPRNIIAVVTRCSDVVKLFNYLNVEALVNRFVVLMFIVLFLNTVNM